MAAVSTYLDFAFYSSIHPDTRAEADRLFAALSEGGTVEMAMNGEFWGDDFGSFKDKSGVQWTVFTSAKEESPAWTRGPRRSSYEPAGSLAEETNPGRPNHPRVSGCTTYPRPA